MEKLQMCRICFVKDARMFKVVNKSLHELYEKLTAKPFVTDDRRPVLVCYFCCTKLKQCCHFQRKCLEAEERYAQMLDEDYEPNPLLNPEVLEFNIGFIKAPMELISIEVEYPTENLALIEEEPADCERLADIIEPKEELQVDELEAELDNLDSSDVEDIPEHHSDSENNVSITEFKTELEEEQDTNWAPVAKKPKLLIRRTKLKALIIEEEKKNEQSDSKERTTEYRTPKQFPKFKEPLIYKNTIVKNVFDSSRSVNNKNVNTNFCNDGSKNDIRIKITNKKKDSDNLNRHRRLCVKDQPYICDVCQFSCNQKCNLTRHIRIHTGEKPYQCEVCQRSFRHKNTLTIHIRKHTGEKPYKCQICAYSCIQKNQLTKHVRIHTGEKPYQCEVCQRSFRQKHALTTHIRIHSGENPYKCQICQYSCKQKSHLTKHIRRHHTKKSYRCT